MKRFLCLFVFCMLCIDSRAQVFGNGEFFVDSFMDDFIDVENGAIINPNSGGFISINSTGITINNDGIINADIDTNHNNLYIRNGGTINGNIIMYDGCDVTQIIKTEADIQSLNVSGNHTVVVDITNFSGMADLNQLQTLNNASSFFVTNSGILINNFSDWQNWDANVYLNGATLYINNIDTVHSGEVIVHVTSLSNVNVTLLNAENLYTVVVGSGPVLKIVRETDYDRVFGNGENGFFTQLRENHIDDKLLTAMDSVNNMTQLRGVMNSSHRFNHSILMRPVRTMNNFSLLNVFNNEDGIGLKLSPVYINGRDTSAYGLRLDIGGVYDDFSVDVGFGFYEFNYENDFNDFDGREYNVDLKVKKYIDKFWVNGVVGLSLTDFKADYIYTDDGIKNNPYGHTLYGGIYGGYDYSILKTDIIISPFVGTAFQKLKVLDFAEHDIDFRGGGNVKYAFSFDSIKYEYSAGGAVATNGDLFAMFKIGFLSVVDEAGMSIGLDVIKTEYDINYRALLSGKLMF